MAIQGVNLGTLIQWQHERNGGNQGHHERIFQTQLALCEWRNSVQAVAENIPEGMKAIAQAAFPHYQVKAEPSTPLGQLQNLLNQDRVDKNEATILINKVSETIPGFAHAISENFQVENLPALRADIEKTLLGSIQNVDQDSKNELFGLVYQAIGHDIQEDHFGENHALDSWDAIGLFAGICQLKCSDNLNPLEIQEAQAAPAEEPQAAPAPKIDLAAGNRGDGNGLFIDFSGEMRNVDFGHFSQGPSLRRYFWTKPGEEQTITAESRPDVVLRLPGSARGNLPENVQRLVAHIDDANLHLDVRFMPIPERLPEKPWIQFSYHEWAHGNDQYRQRLTDNDGSIRTDEINPLRVGLFNAQNIVAVDDAGFGMEMPVNPPELWPRDQEIHFADNWVVYSPANNQCVFTKEQAQAYFVAAHDHPPAEKVFRRGYEHNANKQAVVSLMFFGYDVRRPRSVEELLRNIPAEQAEELRIVLGQ